MSLC